VRKLLALAAALVGALAIGLVPAGAITNGEPDGEGHPYVGLMVAKNAAGNPLWRCSGTLMSPTVFMVAGHCTEAPAASAVIWFSSGSPNGIPTDPNYVAVAAGGTGCANPAVTGYPCVGDATGAVHIHPQYDPNAFFLHDLGVVTLSASVTGRGFGALPEEGALSELPKHASMTAVGYGLQKSFPDAASQNDQALRIRMVAHPRISGIDNNFVGDFAFTTSHDASRGGTCFGDSGGPNFIGDSNVVGGVTSFGTTFTCKGHNGAYRVDQPDDLEWLATFGLAPSS
jgi:Trypsin